LNRRTRSRLTSAPNATPAASALARVIDSVPADRPAVALTFDDGPGEWTPTILDVLRDVGVRATFFVIGESIAGREEILERTHSEGHEIGNHGYHHRNFEAERVPAAEITEELALTSAEVERVLRVRPNIFRPPQCGCSHEVLIAAAACGFENVVNASVWTEDWSTTSRQSVVEGILSHAQLRAGAIVLLHDGRPLREADRWPDCRATVEALEVIVPTLLSRGFDLVTVSELLAEV
jgi:peptidoglycan-N-acetylglucosamine deacetylase